MRLNHAAIFPLILYSVSVQLRQSLGKLKIVCVPADALVFAFCKCLHMSIVKLTAVGYDHLVHYNSWEPALQCMSPPLTVSAPQAEPLR